MGRQLGRHLATRVEPAPDAEPPRAREPRVRASRATAPRGSADLAGKPVLVARYEKRLRRVTHASKILGVAKSFHVYLPDGTLTARGKRYPVLYFFRGHEDEWVNPRQDHSRQRRTVIDAYEEQLRLGRVGPMVLVFPGIASDDNVVSGLLVNMRDPKRAGRHGGVGTGRFEDYFVKELIPLVETSYPVKKGGAHRGAIGFSLGGLMTAKIALQHPGLLTTVGAYDGTFIWHDPQDDRTLRNHIFDAGFGVPRDFEFIEKNSPMHLLERVKTAELERMRFFVEFGPESAEPNDSNFYRGREFLRRLVKRGGRNTGGVVPEGRHNWATADGHVTRTLAAHYSALDHAAVR